MTMGEVIEFIERFAHGHVAVGLWTLVAKSRQAALPIGSEQPQGVPALAPPGVRHLTALKDDVVDRPLAQEVARGKARVPRPDDDGGSALDDSAP
jgi:hypothetical protein